MTDPKPSDELTELEPIDPNDLPDLPELDELPELPEVEELPELTELEPLEPAKPAPKPQPKPAPPVAQQPAPAPKPAPAPAKPEPAAAKPAPAVPVPPAASAPEPPQPAPSQAETSAAPAALTPEPDPAGAEAATAAAAAGATAAAASAPGGKPPLRVLDKAPAHLRKAAAIVCVGSLLPWLGHGGGWLSAGLAKALVLLGAWLWLKQIDHNWGPKLSGFLGKLGELELKPKKQDTKPQRRSVVGADRPAVLTHAFPTGLHLLSLVLVLVACIALPFAEGLTGSSLGKVVAELGMLAWAAYTFVHIHSYERWGPFNPIFPLMFLAMLISGLFAIPAALQVEGTQKLMMLGGGAIVALGGGLAAYTIVEAMMQAKKDGDAKKTAALEARRQARKRS